MLTYKGGDYMDFKKIKEYYESNGSVWFILNDYIHDYRVFLFDENTPKKYKRHTIEESLFELSRFNKFLLAYKPTLESIKDIKPEDIHSYKNFCINELDNNNITVNKKLRALRQFFNYVVRYHSELSENVVLKVAYLNKSKEPPPQFIPRNQLRIIINTLYTLKYGIRDVCITKLIAYTGLKLNEVFSLKVEDVDLINKQIHIKRENKYIAFPIVDKLFLDLKEYNELRKSFFNSDAPCYSFFLSHTGISYPDRAYQYKFKEALIAADIEERYTPRHVRATFCYYMAKEIEEGKLKQILNQKKVTQYYQPQETPEVITEIISNPLLKDI